MPKKTIHWPLAILAVLLLVAIRYVFDHYAYEPFGPFFSQNMQNPMPEYNFWKLFLSLNFRFLSNLSASLLLIYAVFRRRDWLKVALVLLLMQHFLCLGAYLYFVHTHFSVGFHPSYYVRRFLLQPLMLLVLLAVFYYQQHQEKQEKKPQ